MSHLTFSFEAPSSAAFASTSVYGNTFTKQHPSPEC
jgi:hypothetical protein